MVGHLLYKRLCLSWWPELGSWPPPHPIPSSLCSTIVFCNTLLLCLWNCLSSPCLVRAILYFSLHLYDNYIWRNSLLCWRGRGALLYQGKRLGNLSPHTLGFCIPINACFNPGNKAGFLPSRMESIEFWPYQCYSRVVNAPSAWPLFD